MELLVTYMQLTDVTVMIAEQHSWLPGLLNVQLQVAVVTNSTLTTVMMHSIKL